jgi:short-subunit dehydrogenase
MERIVILGATSGMIQPLLRTMAKQGKELLLVARSRDRLDALRTDLTARGASNILTLEADFDSSSSRALIVPFVKECFPGVDTLVLAYGTMLDQSVCQASPEHAIQELQTNLVSAVALLTEFAQYMESRRSGTIAAITSIAGERGRRSNYVYGAAKGGLSIFLEGLRSRMYQFGVHVLTIKAGPVSTPMTANLQKVPFLGSPETVARAIYHALEKPRVNVLYIPRYWKWIMAGIRVIPDSVFKRLSF